MYPSKDTQHTPNTHRRAHDEGNESLEATQLPGPSANFTEIAATRLQKVRDMFSMFDPKDVTRGSSVSSNFIPVSRVEDTLFQRNRVELYHKLTEAVALEASTNPLFFEKLSLTVPQPQIMLQTLRMQLADLLARHSSFSQGRSNAQVNGLVLNERTLEVLRRIEGIMNSGVRDRTSANLIAAIYVFLLENIVDFQASSYPNSSVYMTLITATIDALENLTEDILRVQVGRLKQVSEALRHLTWSTSEWQMASSTRLSRMIARFA